MNAVPPSSEPIESPSPSTSAVRTADLERRRELGQFFTPALVASFIWDMLEIFHRGPFPANARMIDPACGEGVFMCAAVERGLSVENVFGTDIDDTLLPAWLRAPQLLGAGVHLANGLLDHVALGIQEGTFDVVAGNPPFSGGGLKSLLKLLEEPGHQENDLFGAAALIEQSAIQPPSAREFEALEGLVRTLSGFSCWRLKEECESELEAGSTAQDEPTELFATAEINDRRRPTPSEYENSARTIANWPTDRRLDTGRPEVRDAIRRMGSTAIEVLFTERFLRLARRGGLIALIVPDSIVASDRLSLLRRWLAGRMDLLASISLPQKVFAGLGANAKTTILFAQRRTEDRPEGWHTAEGMRQISNDGPLVLLTSPCSDSPEWSLERYLADVLESARADRVAERGPQEI